MRSSLCAVFQASCMSVSYRWMKHKDFGYSSFESDAIFHFLFAVTAISGKVVKNKNFPKCLCKGPRIIQPPAKYETAKRHAMQMNRVQSGWNEEIAHVRVSLSWIIHSGEHQSLWDRIQVPLHLQVWWVPKTYYRKKKRAEQLKNNFLRFSYANLPVFHLKCKENLVGNLWLIGRILCT